jgi:hypothetical protein
MSANVFISAEDFTQTPFALRKITLTPLFDYSVDGLNIVTADRLTQTADTSGDVTFSNVISGTYELEFHGSYKTTKIPIQVSGTGTLNAVNLIGAYTGLNPNLAYSKSQSDSLFYPWTNPLGFVSTVSGAFYPSNNPSGFITGIATGNFVTTGQTGNFVTTAQTGNFYPRSNPSGFITGLATGNFVTSNQTGSFVTNNQTGSFVTTLQTGAFYAASNPSGFITGLNTGSFVTTSQTGSFVTTAQTGSFVDAAHTGSFITTANTGLFYPSSNPSGFLTSAQAGGVQSLNVSGATISGVVTLTGIGGLVISRTGQTIVFSGGAGGTGSANLTNVVFTTGTQTISGGKTFASIIDAPGLSYLGATYIDTNALQMHGSVNGNAVAIDWGNRQLWETNEGATLDWGHRQLTGGPWDSMGLSVNGVNVVLTSQTGSFGGSNPVNVVHTTGTEIISGAKTFATQIAINNGGLSGPTVFTSSNQLLYDGANGQVSVDWNQRLLGSGSSNYALDYGNRLLMNTGGTTTVDWNNRILSGAWTISGAPLATGGPYYPLSNPSGFGSSASVANAVYTTGFNTGNIGSVLNALAPTGSTGFVVDFTSADYSITTNSGISFTSGSNLAAVRSASVFFNTSNSGRNLSFNSSWIWLGSTPTGILSGKAAVLSLKTYGTGQSNIVATWGAQF